MKKILIVSQHFWPERFIINDIAIKLSEQGYQVSVLTAKPNYPKGNFFSGYSFFSKNFERWKGINIYRSFIIPRGVANRTKLFFNYISFAFFGSLRVFFLRESFDIVFVYQTSPITLAIPAIFAKYKFNARLILWVQDLWPDSVSAAGNINSKFVLNFLEYLTRLIYKYTDLILVQSTGFIDFILKQNVSKNKIKVLPNTTESHFLTQIHRNNYEKLIPRGTILMFAGNIGEAQSFETLVNAAKLIKNQRKNLYWIILGDGRKKREIEFLVKKYKMTKNFIFLGSFSSDQMPLFYYYADALIFSLKSKQIYSLTIPSKVQSYMASSKPIIASVNGIASDLIREANCGLVSPAEDSNALAKNILNFTDLSKKEKKRMGENGKKYFEKNFSNEVFLKKINSYFNN